MANIEVATTLEAPKSITISLVRSDFLETSNQFRVCFEISLTFLGAVFGAIISLLSEEPSKKVPILLWIALCIFLMGCIAFLILTIYNFNKAKGSKI